MGEKITSFDNRAMLDASRNIPESVQIRMEQIRLLNVPSFGSAIGTSFAASILAYIQWPVIEHNIVLMWLFIVGLIVIARMAIYFTFKLKAPDSIGLWEKLYVVVTIFAGLTWGAAGIFLFPEGDFVRQAATIVILAGMASGAITTLSALRSTVFIFLLLTMVPLIIHLFLVSGDVVIPVAMVCTSYMLFLLYSANFTYNTCLQNITLRIRSLEREKEVRASEQELLKTSEILKMIAKGDSVGGIYDAIALLYESRHPGLRCSILELKGSKLMYGGAPSLPNEYCEAVNGLENGSSVGSCGTSTYTGKRVIVENIETDPKWVELKEVALLHGLRCCWSEPIKDSLGKVLGAFGMYYDYPALPNEYELADLESAARLAGIVMERQQRDALLQKLHSAFEYANDAIIIADLDARLEYVNPAFERMTGYSAEEAVGEYIKILRSNEHPDTFYDELLKNSQQGKSWQGEVTIKCKDGSFCEVERSVAPVLDAQGNILFQVAIQRDITEQKILEEKFQQAQKMDAIGTLVGGIAHDFNNILAGITGNLYLAKQKLQENPSASQKLINIELLSNRAVGLIEQLLTFARKDRVNMEQLQLLPLVEEVFTFLRTSTPENIDMHLDVGRDSIQINGDSTQVYQVLLNLVNNARDALKDVKEPRITIKIKKLYADELFIESNKHFRTGHYAHISVEDNGDGIAEHQLEHIFEPFFTTKEVGKGTGLGLSMVFGAIKRHHGFVEVKSSKGKGSTFHVYIPLLEVKSTASMPLKEKEANISELGNNELILLVDDEVKILEMGEEVLETLGYKVLRASDGLEAAKIFMDNQDEISLIITDIVMPRLGGVQAIQRITKIRPDIKVIFSTGYDIDAALDKVISLNEHTIISKPFNIEELSKIIKNKLNSQATLVH